MGSGKGTTKRVNINAITSLFTNSSFTDRYVLSGIKPRDHVFEIGNYSNEEIEKNTQLIYSFIDQKEFDLFIFAKNNATLDVFPYDHFLNKLCLSATQEKILGICLHEEDGTKIIIVNQFRLDEEFNNIVIKGRKLFPNHFISKLNDGDLFNNLNLCRQSILLHELGHALDDDLHYNPTPLQESRAELVAELFSAKLMEKLYGKNLLSQVFAAGKLIKEYNVILDVHNNASKAKRELMKAERKADVMIKNLYSFM